MIKPSSSFLSDRSKAVLILWVLLSICVSCLIVLSVPYSLVVTCWERDGLLALMYVCDVFCVFVTFPYGVLGQVWYFIVMDSWSLLSSFLCTDCQIVFLFQSGYIIFKI